jgi:hypothetical protein
MDQAAEPSSQRPYLFLTFDMADQSGSSHFQAALWAYEKKPGVKLAKHPLANPTPELPLHRRCHYPSTGTARTFNDSQASDRTLKSIKTIVSILTPLSDALALAGAIGLVRQTVLSRWRVSN